MSKFYPIRFEPVYRNYIWGGRKIIEKYDRSTAEKIAAESWEISDRESGMSVVQNGPYKGKTLLQLEKELGEELFGQGRDCSSFPLLVKLIDAREPLSVQVHPGEGGKGDPKSELWYILEADPGAVVYAGLGPGVYPEKFKQGIKRSKVDDLLEKIEVKEGDVIYVPGGLVHAIGAGCLIFEVQQNSDTTYRIYDWDRQGRQLHPEQALEAIDWTASRAKVTPHKVYSDLQSTLWMVLSSPHFVVQKVEVYTSWHVPRRPDTFQIYFCINGEAELTVDQATEALRPGLTYLIPAGAGGGIIKGRCQVLIVTLEIKKK